MSRRRLVITLILLGLVVLPALAAAVLLLLGETRWGGVLLAVVVAGAAALLVDLHRRAREIAHMLRISAERQREISGLLVTIVGSADADADAASVRNSVVGRIEASERRLLDALSATELRVAQMLEDAGAAPDAPDAASPGDPGTR